MRLDDIGSFLVLKHCTLYGLCFRSVGVWERGNAAQVPIMSKKTGTYALPIHIGKRLAFVIRIIAHKHIAKGVRLGKLTPEGGSKLR